MYRISYQKVNIRILLNSVHDNVEKKEDLKIRFMDSKSHIRGE